MEYLAPDVYIEEVNGNQPIEGVSTSTTGFVGMTRRGPDVGVPQLVTSFEEFRRNYGGYFDLGPTFLGHNSLPYAVYGFFSNLGKRLYISRVVPAGASVASTAALGGLVTRLQKDTTTDVATNKSLAPATLRGVQVGTKLQLRMIKNGVSTDSPVLTVQSIDDRGKGAVTVDSAASTTVVFEARFTTVFTDVNTLAADGKPTALANPTAARPQTFTISARDKGSWGKDIVVQARHESAAGSAVAAFVKGGVDDNQVRLTSGASFYAKAWVEFDRGSHKVYRKVKAVDGPVLTLFGPALTAADIAPEAPATTTLVSTCEFRVSASYDNANESFGGLTLEKVPGRYYYDILHSGSGLLEASQPPPPADTHPFLFPSGGDGLNVVLDTAGSDGAAAPVAPDYRGVDNGPGKRSGIQALSEIDEISIVAVPGITDPVVQGALIEHCQALRYRFAILDPAPKAGNLPPGLDDIQNQRRLFDTKYAAIYYPRVLAYDPLTDATIPQPPSGFIAGIYARTDDRRGVHKPPANEVISAISGLEQIISKGEQEVLNPEPMNVNVLRDFRHGGRGLRVWGARCITSETEWKYVNVRRLFLFIERSIELGTQWAVFEPNDSRLWARVGQSVSAFLTRVWRDGGLVGARPEEAFFVKCDVTTMTRDDMDNGRMIMLVGIAPVKPAEFVIVRIGQWYGGSSVQEL